MALTMLDMAALQQPVLVKAVMMAMFKGRLPSPMEYIPVANAQALSQRVSRLTDAGSPSTRKINEAVAAYSAHFTTGTETLSIIENKITVDKVLLAEKNHIQDPVTMQTKTYAAIVKNTVNDLLINGDPAADPSKPAGLQYRLAHDSLFVAQCVDANAVIGAYVGTNEATRLAFIDCMDEAVTLCGGGAPDVAIVNRQTWLRVRSVLRAQKVLDVTRDQFDREILTWGRIKFLNAGQVPASALTSAKAGQVILDDGSTSAFGTASTTPLYFLSTDSDEGAKLLQLHGLKVTKVGLDPGDPGQFVVDVTWPIGFYLPQKFCLSSVQGLNITA